MMSNFLFSTNKKLRFILVFFIIFLPLQAKALLPNDTYLAEQTHLEEIGALEAWNKSTGSNDVIIAVIDTGVDFNHPDLVNNIWVNQDEIDGDGIDNDNNGFIDDMHGWNFLADNNYPRPLPGPVAIPEAVHHGTVIAGLIAAEGNNNQGVAGINWQAKIMAIRALNNQGQGQGLDVAEAIDYAVNNGAQVINMSLVGPDEFEELKKAIERAYDKGVVIVAAGGNDESEGDGIDLDKTPHYPVCYQGEDGENLVLGIGAVNELGEKASFSGFGYNCIDISAPGVNLLSTAAVFKINPDFSDYYLTGWSGTSISSALISGAAALLKAYQPTLTNKEIYDFLIQNGDPLNNLKSEHRQKMGSKLNLAKAMRAVESKFSSVSEPLPEEPEPVYDLDLEFSAKQKGRLFLQVEDGGRIWYVDTLEARRHEVTFANALTLFESLSLGITNVNLEKIPLAGTSGIGDKVLREKLKGKLLLQVEDGGRIWYVDNVFKQRYEATWLNLMELFESLAVGITNGNLHKIPVGAL